MTRLFLCLSFAFLCLTSCSSKEKKTNNDEQNIVQKSPVAYADDIIPIRFSDHIYVPCIIDSVKGNFVFDTGADYLYLDSIFYADNNIRYPMADYRVRMGGAGAKVENLPVIGDSVYFTIEGDTVYNCNIVPIIQLKSILGDYADGIIGGAFFKSSVLEIDYDNSFMRKYDALDSVSIDGYQKISMREDKRRFFVPLEVQLTQDLKVKGDFLLDLGSGGTVSFTSATALKYNIDKHIIDKALFYTKYGGIGGNRKDYSFLSDHVSIAGSQLDNVLMEFSLNKTGALSSDKHMGLLGCDILRNFDLIIDFIHNDLYLKPNSIYNTGLSDIPSLGFSYVNRGETLKCWVVTGFYAGSNAEASGLKIDDRIVVVNSKRIEDITEEEENEIFRNSPDVNLTVIRGEETLNFSFKKKNVF